MADIKKTIYLDLDREDILNLYGIADENLKLIERALKVNIIGKDNKVVIKGSKKESIYAERVITSVMDSIGQGKAVSKIFIEEIIDQVKGNGSRKHVNTGVSSEFGLLVSSKRDLVKPKTVNQRLYLNTISDKQITFGIGPAGTGKTYLAIASALYFLREKKVERIVLVRPVVEAGESLGFLPGDMKEKIDPYLKPLYDAMYDMIEPRIFKDLVDNEIIEIAPLAYMRGRTLNKAFVILDEAQNTTIDQMKMFLTRTGNQSRVVITGDVTQIDLPVGRKSGLLHARDIFKESQEIAFVNFTAEDVSRAEIVKRILEAYEKYENGGN